MLALNGGRPELMNLKQIIEAFLEFREQVITRRTIYELGKARERAHPLLGLGVAVANLAAVIPLIRRETDHQVARELPLPHAWPANELPPLRDPVDAPGSPPR